LFSDDHAVQAVGAYGGWLQSINPTPNLDRLAEEGMVFEKAYVAHLSIVAMEVILAHQQKVKF